MICQEISRFVDSGKFIALGSSERHAAETHAQSCRHCAPLWFAHARLAATPVPGMPPELSVRCLTLAAAEVAAGARAPSSQRVSRTMMVAGSLVVLAAVASMLMVYVANAPAPQGQHVAIPVAAPDPAGTLENAVVPASAAVPADPVAEAKALPYSLPLLPAPIGADAERKSQIDLAKRKALELYPELTQGPEIKGQFVVSLALRADGTVLDKSLSIATNVDEVNKQMHSMKPLDGSQVFVSVSRSARLEGDRTLRGDLTLAFSVVPNSYDVSRSDTRVQEIVLAEREHLLMPLSKDGRNRLTVLLSGDGTIQRESAEFLGRDELRQPAAQRSEDAPVRARDLARALGVSADQIGLMGSTYLQATASDPANTRVLMIDYAWTRRANEAAPAYRQSSDTNWGPGIDMAAALAIVERLIPEAFIPVHRSADEPEGPSTHQPTVILTADGRVIGTGTTNMQLDVRPQYQRIAPGVEMGTGTTATVRNSAGMTADVLFAWEATAAQKEAMEKARNSASDR